jgi:hypothetical protein
VLAGQATAFATDVPERDGSSGAVDGQQLEAVGGWTGPPTSSANAATAPGKRSTWKRKVSLLVRAGGDFSRIELEPTDENRQLMASGSPCA